jgi:two-component system, response regulator YesN
VKTCLIVDDESDVSDPLARLLRLSGWRALTERDGLRALQTLEVEQVDAVIADERMPGTAGALLLETIHRAWPHVRLVLLSGLPSKQGTERALAIGARVLSKGCSVADVIEAIGG